MVQNRIAMLGALALVPVLLSGCQTNLQKLQKLQPVGVPFSVALTQEYLAFAESEADQYDWSDSSYFAKKGIDIGYGTLRKPEKLEDWDIPKDVLPTLVQARSYLMEVLDSGVTATRPQQAAQAQVMFDCWVEQQEEAWQEDDIQACREGFYNVLDKLYAQMYPSKSRDKLKEDAEKARKAVSQAAKMEAPGPYDIYFGFNKTKLDKNAKEVIYKVIADLRKLPNFQITLNGYADRSGRPAYNMQLSKKRALGVKKMLEDAGVDGKRVTIFAFGETAPRKPTKDGRSSHDNRLVEVVVEVK